MKIVYMGTPDFAVAPLAALVKNGYEVEAVITQPDKPKGRGKTMMPTPVKEEALKHDIPVLQPVKVRDPEFVEKLAEIAPDIIVVAAFWTDYTEEYPGDAENSDVSISMHPYFRNTAERHQSSRQLLTGKKNPALRSCRWEPAWIPVI